MINDWLLILIGVIVIGFFAARGLRKMGRTAPRIIPEPGGSTGKPAGETPAPSPQPMPVFAPVQATASQPPAPSPLALAAKLEDFYDSTSHPEDLLRNADFEAGVARLVDPSVPLEQVVNFCVGANPQLAAFGAEALARRHDSAPAIERAVNHLRYANVWTVFYILRFLDAHASGPVIGLVLAQTRGWWPRNPLLPKILGDFVDARLKKGEQPNLRTALESTAQVETDEVAAMIDALSTAEAGRLRDAFQLWHRTRVDVNFLQSVGRVWPIGDEARVVVEHAELSANVESALAALEQDPPQSFLITGETGVGKTALFRLLATRLMNRGWTIFEATAADVLAGQVYIGEIERRVKQMQDNLGAERRVLWYLPNFHELYYAGRHRFNPNGVLDLFLPAVEARRLCIVGEVQTSALHKLLQERPRVRLAFKEMKLAALSDSETLELAQRLVEQEFVPARVSVDAGVLREAFDLARHYLSSRAQPGNLIELLRATKARLASDEGAMIALGRDDLLVTLSELTGLPRSVLDEREGLEPAGLREFFQQRVMGQPEAVTCLVDRVAMLKAGLTDPNRPIGVFLFAGPTGTGKTEVAKTLAEFLFGSPERMVRLDMSEFQDSPSVARIVGDTSEAREVDSLVSRIRKQPFSVVLLDEFEKAHPRVWDLFLQVFDDGRLTGADGGLADFRYSIIVLTSNLGATQHRAASLGFNPASGEFSEQQILRVIGDTFRPELVNRLDRVVVFRPLSRMVMRDILKKELRNVLQRRGFRNREWAVEWEESALEFLLDKGFTPDMGARPLRRAIEQHLLAPIAMTIVEHRFPQGDQFLFVRSDGTAIQVEFVDPEAEPGAAPESVTPAAELSLPPLVLTPTGRDDERRFLEQRLTVLEAGLESADWLERRQRRLKLISRTGFWNSDDRFETLAQIELVDRIESGARAARSLSNRLASRAGTKSVAPRTLVSALAQQLYLLNVALEDLNSEVGSDAFIAIESVAGDAIKTQDANAWPLTLVQMYQQWAHKRQMRMQVLSEVSSRSGAFAWLATVSGLGARAILSREVGLHVLEVPDSDGSFLRQSARVRVAAQPFNPKPSAQSEMDFARARLASAASSASNIVRRYREQPSPLVRDSVAGWRTGRLDQVLGGDFDLMS